MTKKELFRKVRSARVCDKDAKILELCKNKYVLDVGCVGQIKNYNNKEWLHDKIRKISNEVHGVDIEQSGITKLKQMGYLIYHVNELSKLQKPHYDVIVMGDVIEHVNDPVNFLKFYSDFLNDNGVIIVTTPNSHRVRNFIDILISNDYLLNSEHTMWFCPKTFVEITIRANLMVEDFFWLKEIYDITALKSYRAKLKFYLNSLLCSFRTNFNPNFMFILRK